MINSKTIDEKEIIALIKKDDEQAYKLLSRLYGKDILLKAKSITKNHEDAEELTQDALLKIRKGIFSFRGESSLKTWIFRIISNLSINRLKKVKRRGSDVTTSLDAVISASANEESFSTFADVLPSSDMSPADILERSDNEAIMNEAMQSLPKEYAEIMRMRVAEELSYEEIAQKLGLSIGTVKSRIARARDCLREKLEQFL
ncbi:MAG: sigma-70 family RNA polymerase sigma factor [Opitutales bacterium]|nr:sigma-70 family RNA polymerase sigma factor [Opitutales bacterium]